MATILPGDGSSIWNNFSGTAIAQSLGPIAKESLANGYFDTTTAKDLYSNTINTQSAWKNPNANTEADIKQIFYSGNHTGWIGKDNLPSGWNNPNYSDRASITELSRPMTDIEIDQMYQIEGLFNDFHRHGNIQSGVDQTPYTSNPFGIIGKHKSFNLPDGHMPKPIQAMLSIGSGINSLNTSLGSAAAAGQAIGSGPCKFIEALFGAISKGGAILAKILNFISQALGLLNLINGIIGFVKQLAAMILADLAALAGAIARITNAALAGLLDGLMSDPCLKHLITAGIAGVGLYQTIKSLT